MWIVIGVIGAGTLINYALTLFMLYRMRDLEIFMVIMSGVIVGGQTSAELAAYLKSRSDHPAGKNRERLPRRMDEGGAT